MEYVLLFVSAALVNNLVLNRFWGICPFIGVSKSFDAAYGMSAAVLFVMCVSSVVTWLINGLLLVPYGLGYLQTVVFILVIASLVQFVEMVTEKTSPELYAALGIFLPLITTNCAVFGVSLINIQQGLGFVKMLIFTFGSAIGFGLALVLFAGLRERLLFSDVPKAFKGAPVAFITAGILALAFMGFSGLTK
ncbi:MAG: electron transport complex subunit RsxA [Deferribacteraceae bacterium]|jgi:electron transport complex protein RnfA|nr:electron transport complex subunit RsxA [Deferribacteraceae bacterium]